MFRPIKNFITYIQKNASGSTMFGSGATTTTNIERSGQPVITTEPATPGEQRLDLAQMEPSSATLNGSSGSNNADVPRITKATAEVIQASVATAYDDADDIELQIKRSVMLKPTTAQRNGNVALQQHDALTLKQIASAALQKQNPNWNAEYRQHNATTVTTRAQSVDALTAADPLQVEPADEIEEPLSVAETPTTDNTCQPPSDGLDSRLPTPIDDELQDFAHDPMANMLNDDICSLDSATERNADEETLEDFITEEEVEVDVQDCDDSFIKLEDLRNPDLIIVNDSDLNSSIASDALSEDPLATDNEVPVAGLLDNSTNDDASASSVGMLWHIKLHEVHATNVESDGGIDSAESTPQRCKVQQQQQHNQLTHVITPKNDSASVTEQPEELRSDGGSDSGLGSETSALLQTTIQSPSIEQTLTDAKLLDQAKPNAVAANATQHNDEPQAEPTKAVALVQKPLRSNLKRRLEAEDDSLDLTDGTTGTLLPAKKPKRSINFDRVQVYYFPRQQGFGCVPSAGGCTLGMGAQHVAIKTLTLAEHAAELRRAHRMQLQENPRGSSSEDSEESEEDYLSEGSGSDLDAESNGFLQPMSPKQRRALLKAAGVRKIDASEKLECRDIRNSREVCGCTCREYCDPETCACSQAGIKCQVDRAMFPCGCSRDACGNTVGRVEFNPARVRTHFIHTLMRLEMENRQQQNPSSALCGSSIYAATAASATVTSLTHNANNATTTTTNYYNSLQTQSNYSSGYASPAYMPDQSASTNANVYFQQTTATSAHFVSEMHSTSAGVAAGISSSVAPQYHQLDSLDGGLFSHAPQASSTVAPAYGDMLPNYNSNAGATTSAYHTLSYGSATPVSLYSSYHHTTLTTTNYVNAVSINNNFSSCAVPTAPPCGSATTTASAIDTHYQTSAPCLALSTVAPSCSNSLSNGTSAPHSLATNCAATTTATTATALATSTTEHANSSFINLNTPVASSSRLSQINDLLQHNRNTTAALVAVAKSPNLLVGARNFQELTKDAAAKQDTLAASDSINTPPIIEQPAANSHTFDCAVSLGPPATLSATQPNFMPNGHSAAGASLEPIQMEPPP